MDTSTRTRSSPRRPPSSACPRCWSAWRGAGTASRPRSFPGERNRKRGRDVRAPIRNGASPKRRYRFLLFRTPLLFPAFRALFLFFAFLAFFAAFRAALAFLAGFLFFAAFLAPAFFFLAFFLAAALGFGAAEGWGAGAGVIAGGPGTEEPIGPGIPTGVSSSMSSTSRTRMRCRLSQEPWPRLSLTNRVHGCESVLPVDPRRQALVVNSA